MPTEHIHFVTGKLAERALLRVLEDLRSRVGFEYTVDVLPITVAALMTPAWIAQHLRVPGPATRIVLPGYCGGDLAPLESITAVPIQSGPKDLRQLPAFFDAPPAPADYGDYDIEIIAEINHAPRIDRHDLLGEARRLAAAGADVIDLGCDPGSVWTGVADCVRALKQEGLRVSIDSFSAAEIEPAARAGAELVLSVNRANREAAADWGCEVVAISDEPSSFETLFDNVEYLSQRAIPFRVDPILEPIGCGFAASLGRYLEARRRLPDKEIMMGIGNLTELTDADSAAINVLLLGFCQEAGIRSVLTTEVINWARSSVKECDLARRLVYHAVGNRVPPKHVEAGLVMLRDANLPVPPDFEELAEQLRDHNYRIHATGTELHLLAANLHLSDQDPFRLFAKLLETKPTNVTPSHAFYLGYELSKAAIAKLLGKQYEQDEALDWGFLTIPEDWHRLTRK